ncbi:hypothetical protein [Corynebacterium accolens]|uniref:hypothetical protein n=1 Tax=Corynebacterium accolens TaxID=38284 RepID=UPI002543C3B9|nr:hypothetical protein [Corynebacterium accolens]MDK4280142.1 hypothetical protein [Corynebacterium accolens]
MDISTIQTHLDNFVATWTQWHNIVEAVHSLVTTGKESFGAVSSNFPLFAGSSHQNVYEF